MATIVESTSEASTPPSTPLVVDARDKYFDTTELTKDLGKRTVRGGAVTLSAQAIKFCLRLGSTAILARLLTPADFGLIAMVTVVTGFVEMFKDAGLSMATVQREKITHAQVSTLFWINVGLSVVIMFVIAALAPLIAWFYNEPRLLMITLALSGTIIFGGLSVQHQALLRRNMQFGRLAIIEIVSMAAGIGTAIAMAMCGYTYWSLVGMTAATAVVTAVLSILLSGWIPGFPVKRSGAREMLHFGAGVTGFSFVNYFSRNADNFLIGWWWGAGPLGVYNKAYGMLLMPSDQIIRPVFSVASPLLCRFQSEPEQFRTTFRQVIYAISFITMPGMAVLLIVSDAVVFIILGDQWAGAIPIFSVLGCAAIFQGVYHGTGHALVAMGKGQAYFRMALIIAIPTFSAFITGLPFGPLGVAVGYTSVNTLLVCPVLFWFVAQHSPVKIRDFYTAIGLPLALSAVTALLLLLARVLLGIADHLSLLLLALICASPGVMIGMRHIHALGKSRVTATLARPSEC